MEAAERVARINALARKKREEGLTDGELAEQAALRAEYLRDFRQNMDAMLSNVVVERPDGTLGPLRKKPGAGNGK